ncbi:hypothetical protein FBU31_003953 [Coemansia sp. 'formosensis']|nr:hypothetical protein FBU31_003953 [Coemansia sp. 'formosensis']
MRLIYVEPKCSDRIANNNQITYYASTTSFPKLAAKIKDAQRDTAMQSALSPLAVVLAAEGVYTPATLPLGSTVLVVGKPHAVVSSAEASAALDSALNELAGVIGESPANAAFADKITGFLTTSDLLVF